MAVDLDCLPPEGTCTSRVGRGIPAQVGRSPLAQAIHVENGDYVVQLVVAGLVERFPDGALGHFAVTQQHPDTERQPVNALSAESHSNSYRQALPEGAGRHVHPGQAVSRAAVFGALQRFRMTLQTTAELA